MAHLRQYPGSRDTSSELLYQALARDKINLPCIGIEAGPLGHALSCCLEGPVPGDRAGELVSMVSVYPHGSKSATLGYLLALFADQAIPFSCMVSSNAMISFIIGRDDRAGCLAMLEKTFDLPPTHTPYEPSFQEETAEFVKKRYQETKAYFQEKRIKTYGFSLEADLALTGFSCAVGQLGAAGRAIRDMDTPFYFSSALVHDTECHIYCLTRAEDPCADPEPGISLIRDTVDLVTFHGPHFGDRFGIFNTAAACLEVAGIDLILAGCTGASISLVVPAGMGRDAFPALEKGFETP